MPYPTNNGTAVVALVSTLGICARREIQRHGQTGQAMAVTAMVLGALELVPIVIFAVLMLVTAGSIIQSGPRTAQAGTGQPVAGASAAPTAAAAAPTTAASPVGQSQPVAPSTAAAAPATGASPASACSARSPSPAWWPSARAPPGWP